MDKTKELNIVGIYEPYFEPYFEFAERVSVRNVIANRYSPVFTDQPMVLSRQVVLLTGDRTLRIKARCAYVPVTPLRPFVMWSNLKPVALPPEVEELISHPSRKSPSPTAASGKKPRKNRGRQK